MIVRKPYAFLIKYFKVIHIILFVLMTYMLFRVRSIYMFFRNFLRSGTFIYVSNMASKYISLPMIITCILLVLFLLLIYFLMRQKKKPVFYYLSATIFYVVTFISLLYLTTVFSSLEYTSYNNQYLVIFRDLTMVLYYLNFIFLAISFIRGFGFNVKKFNFEKDIKELDITEEDREEIEVGVTIDKEKFSNFFRKRRRYLKYYFKENAYILIVFLVITLLSTSAYFTFNRLVINKIYTESDIVSINQIDHIINDSYITNKDKNGKEIKSGNNYVIINFTLYNKNVDNKVVDISKYRLKINNKYYYPNYNITSSFSDLGKIYDGQKLLSNNSQTYILVFNIEDNKNKNMILEMYKSEIEKNGDISYLYENVKLEPKEFIKKDLGTYKFMNPVSLSDTYLNANTFTMNKYELLDIENYTYTKCDNSIEGGKCVDYNASVVPKVGKVILKIEYGMDVNLQEIFNNLNIKYQKNKKEYEIKNTLIKNITPNNYQEQIVLLEVSNDIKDASDIEFLFDFRGITFKYQADKK